MGEGLGVRGRRWGSNSGFYFPAIFRLPEAVSNHEERLIQLEARYAWLERHVAEQDKAMAEMADEIRRLRRETEGLRERLVQAAGNEEQERRGRTAAAPLLIASGGSPSFFSHRFEQAAQFRAQLPEFPQVRTPIAGRGSLGPVRRQAHFHPAPVGRRRGAAHQAAPGQPVDQADGAVVAELEPFGEFTDRDIVAFREALDREQRLVLLRGQARGAGRLLAELLETAQGVPEGGQPLVVGLGEGSGSHADRTAGWAGPPADTIRLQYIV